MPWAEPNTPQVWAKLQWSGDAGEAIPGQANRRRLSVLVKEVGAGATVLPNAPLVK